MVPLLDVHTQTVKHENGQEKVMEHKQLETKVMEICDRSWSYNFPLEFYQICAFF